MRNTESETAKGIKKGKKISREEMEKKYLEERQHIRGP